jgi:Tol biopolymer transport system component
MTAQASAQLSSELLEKIRTGTRKPPMLEKMLEGPMKDVEHILFCIRIPGRDHWYVTFGNYSGPQRDPKELAWKEEDGLLWGYGDGSALVKQNIRTGEIDILFHDERGGIRDPQLHYNGKKILMSYRPGGTHVFHLYEIDIDGTNLRQLTDGIYDDIEPTYCPDGTIIFCSARCKRFVNCWHTPVATLYRCDADGQNVRLLSSNNDHDNTPWLLPDGRVLYMRWEYVDRSQVDYHHLWTMNPDGSQQMVYFGNQHPGIAMLDAKSIPGTDNIVSIFSPGHGSP